jgi:outer membrane protein assembly factor BamB
VASEDPDAIWKPGYTGEIVYRSAPSEARRPSSRRRLVLGIGVAAVAAMAGLAVPRLTGDREGTDASALDRIPTQIRERWTATLDRPVGPVTGTDDVIVARAGRELVALDAHSGTELWRVAAPGDAGELEVMDGVVVYHDVTGRPQTLAGFDLDGGHRLWSKRLRQGPEMTLAGDNLVIPGFSAGGMVNSVEFLDPRTGSRLAAFEGEDISLSSTAIRRRVDDVVEWYDRNTFDLRARIDLATLGLDGLRTAGAPTDAGLVIATYDRAWLLDADGKVASSLTLSRKLVAPWSLDELDGSGRYLILQGVDTTTLLTVRDGELVELWTRPVAPIDWMMDYSRTIMTVQQRSPEGSAMVGVVDAPTGRAIFSGRQPGLHGPTLGRNGFVAGTEPADDGSWSVVGYDFNGTELWRLPVPKKGWPTLLPGALLTIDDEPDTRATILTLLS